MNTFQKYIFIAADAVDGGRAGQVAFRNVEVAVVLHHARIDHIRPTNAVEVAEIILLEGSGDFKGAVTAEVEIDDAVAVLDGADGLAVFGDDEGPEVLVDGACLLAEGLDGLLGAGELASFAKDPGDDL